MKIMRTDKIIEIDARQFAHRFGVSHPLAQHLLSGQTVTVLEDAGAAIIKAGFATDVGKGLPLDKPSKPSPKKGVNNGTK